MGDNVGKVYDLGVMKYRKSQPTHQWSKWTDFSIIYFRELIQISKSHIISGSYSSHGECQ